MVGERVDSGNTGIAFSADDQAFKPARRYYYIAVDQGYKRSVAEGNSQIAGFNETQVLRVAVEGNLPGVFTGKAAQITLGMGIAVVVDDNDVAGVGFSISQDGI